MHKKQGFAAKAGAGGQDMSGFLRDRTDGGNAGRKDQDSLKNSALAGRLSAKSPDVFFDPFNCGRYATDASFYQIMRWRDSAPHRGRGAAGAGDRPG